MVAGVFNVYGPGMDPDDGREVLNFLVLRGQPLTIYGDGSHTCSFCFVEDLIKGLVRLSASSYASRSTWVTRWRRACWSWPIWWEIGGGGSLPCWT